MIERMLLEAEESHPIAMREIIERLARDGIQAERKSVYADLEELRAVGMEIHFRKGKPAGYYLAGENSGLMRIRQAAGIISGQTENKEPETGEASVESEASVQASKEPLKEILSGEPEKMSARAWSADVPDGEKEQERPDGIQPWEHTDGEYREIQLRCKKSAFALVIKRYGENCRILKEDEKQVLAAVVDVPGNSFYGWLVAQGGAVRPLKPKETAKEYRKLLKKILESYK